MKFKNPFKPKAQPDVLEDLDKAAESIKEQKPKRASNTSKKEKTNPTPAVKTKKPKVTNSSSIDVKISNTEADVQHTVEVPNADMDLVEFIFGDDDSEKGRKESKKIFQKPIVQEKLTIFLVENTSDVEKEKYQLEQIVKSRVTSGYVQVINYGSAVRKSEIFKYNEFDANSLLYPEDIGENACLYNALDLLEFTINECGMLEFEYKKVQFTKFDIIGIGNCINNCSTISEFIALRQFAIFSKKPNINTKYFCITEAGFVQAATIGFRSIGAIKRNYV